MSDSYHTTYAAYGIWPKLAIMLHWKFITGLGWVTLSAEEWYKIIMNKNQNIKVNAFSDSGGGVQSSTEFTIQELDKSGWPYEIKDAAPPLTIDGSSCAPAKKIFNKQEEAINYIRTYSGLKRGSLIEHIHELGCLDTINVDEWYTLFGIDKVKPFTLPEIKKYTSCVMSIKLTGEYLEGEILNEKFPEYGSLALKALMFNDYALWQKGALFAIISMVRAYQTAC